MVPLADLRAELASIELLVFDFDGVFTDNAVWVDQDGVESVRCWRSDGLGLQQLKKLGVPMAIVSTERNPVVSARARKLDLPCRQDIADKAAAVRELCREFGVAPERTAFLGNDINDIEAFHVVGLPLAVADAYPAVHPHVKALTRRPGGHGAVRELCDEIVLARQGASAPATR